MRTLERRKKVQDRLEVHRVEMPRSTQFRAKLGSTDSDPQKDHLISVTGWTHRLCRLAREGRPATQRTRLR